MTYENTLLKYFTGNLEKNTGNNIPKAVDNGTVDFKVYTYIRQQLSTLKGAYRTGVTNKIQDISTGNWLYYGNWTESSTDDEPWHGYIALFDTNLQPITIITEFSSGTLFNQFLCLEQDENGNFYGIDAISYVVTGQSQHPYTEYNKARFIMLNNVVSSGVVSGDYSCFLRKSYYLENAWQSLYLVKNSLYKKNGSSDYLIVCKQNENSTNTTVIKLEVQTGESNKWEYYTNNADLLSVHGYATDWYFYEIATYLSWGDTLQFNVVGYDGTNIVKLGLVESNDTYTLNTLNTFTTAGRPFSIINLDSQVYYVSTGQYNSSTGKFKNGIAKIDGATINYVYEAEYDAHDSGDFRYLYLTKANNNIFSWEHPTIAYVGMPSGYILGMLINDNYIYITDWFDLQTINTYQDFMYITILYNYIEILVPYATYNSSTNEYTAKKFTLIYNSNNYNGEAYENVNALVPNYGVIYNNNIPIFARNLYNKTINNNTTISTIEIPNTLLNDISIQQKSLFGETNLLLTTNDTVFTKNIYENVLLNFYQTLIMQNRNNLDNIITNNLGASYLNESATLKTNYDDIKAVKVKINYEDNTSNIITLSPSTQIVIDTTDNTKATYTFNITVLKAIKNIEIISNDESMVYQTITGDFKINYSYQIKQDVRIITQ